MVCIGNQPIICHIMERYAYYGYKDFIIALGYKANIIKDYFYSRSMLGGDLVVDFESGTVESSNRKDLNWKVTLVETGINTMTGGRLKRLLPYLGEQFMLTYGDGLADIDISKLVSAHTKSGLKATVTAVRPPARFGELKIKENVVTEFAEKPQMDRGWISGGYFVLNKDVVSLMDGDETMFEREPLEHLSKTSQLNAFRHEGFWQCMDTKRDLEYLRELEKDTAPWVAERL
jgi:glucose-1-phosphate cytidylyltransferase